MNVTIQFFANFREATDTNSIQRTFSENVTVEDVLERIETEFDGLTGAILENEKLKSQVNVHKNGRAIEHLTGLDTPVEDGDRLSMCPPVAGG